MALREDLFGIHSARDIANIIKLRRDRVLRPIGRNKKAGAVITPANAQY